ncbi:MAG TPA: hypothetical protein VGV60_05950 [Candidatus Polarisedimenticolia bacterium]|jgi:hypothetical protein|nr:hypothetical protein [Candidatus Polarisedimenticolia bacterium]
MSGQNLSRRAFTRDMLHSLVIFSLIEICSTHDDPSRGFACRMDFVDLDRAEVLKVDILCARRLDVDEALRLCGQS